MDKAKMSTIANRAKRNKEWPKHQNIYEKCMEKAADNPGSNATQWLHLADAVETGSISPLEAYETLNLGYVAAHLTTRNSKYSHLL